MISRTGMLWAVAVSAIGALLFFVYSGVHAFESECRLRLWEKCRFDGNSAFYNQNYRLALAKYREALGYSRSLDRNNFRLGVSLANVAMTEEALSNLPAAESLYRQSVEEMDRVHYGESESVSALLLKQDLAESLNQLGNVLLKENRLDAAEPHFERALSIADSLVRRGGSMSRDRTISQQRVIALSGLADISFKRRDFKKAEPLYLSAVKLAEETLVPESLNEKIRVNMALMLQSTGRGANLSKILPDVDWEKQVTLADGHIANLRLPEAEKCLRAAVRALDQYGLEDVRLAETLGKLGNVLSSEHKDNQAIAALTRAIDMERRLHKGYDEDMNTNMHRLVALYLARGRFHDAEPLLKEQITLREIAFGADDYQVAEESGSLAYVLSRNGRKDEARVMATRALDQLRDRAKKKFRVSKILRNMALIFIEAGDYNRAEESLRLGMLILKTKPQLADSRALFFANACASLGSVHLSKNEPGKAEAELVKAMEFAEKARGQRGLKDTENRILATQILVARKMGNGEKATRLEERRKLMAREVLDDRPPAESYSPGFDE